MAQVAKILAVVVVALVALGAAWFIGMRNKSSPVVKAQRHINKILVNPKQLRTAGTPGSYASVIKHVGRSSGHEYATPVGAVRTPDGFAIALMYGPSSDWVQNLLDAGSGTLIHEGEEYPVLPELAPFEEAANAFPDQRSLRRFGVQHVMRLRQTTASS